MADGKKVVSVYSCFKGEVISLDDTKNEMFQNLGIGVAIIPSDGTIYAPVDATVTSVFPTKHIIGFAVDDGEENGGFDMLIHMGVDTAALKGKPFKIATKAGKQVKAGEVLGTMDLACLKENEKSPITPVLVTNEGKCEIEILQGSGEVDLTKPLYKVTREIEDE